MNRDDNGIPRTYVQSGGDRSEQPWLLDIKPPLREVKRKFRHGPAVSRGRSGPVSGNPGRLFILAEHFLTPTFVFGSRMADCAHHKKIGQGMRFAFVPGNDMSLL